MKKLTIALLLLQSACYSQEKDTAIKEPDPTTEEEYNYIVNGYRDQVYKGLDMKKGYRFIDIGPEETVIDRSYTFTFKALMREANGEVAGILVKAHSANSGNTYYLCIPHDNQALIEKYWTALSGWDGNINRAYAKIVSLYMNRYITTLMEMAKQKQ